MILGSLILENDAWELDETLILADDLSPYWSECEYDSEMESVDNCDIDIDIELPRDLFDFYF